jgi:hypothetical protein
LHRESVLQWLLALRRHLTYSNVVATLALFIALGGSGYAAVQLRAGQVKTRHIANGAVTGVKVKNSSLRREDLRLRDRGPLTYPPFIDLEAGRKDVPTASTIMVLTPEYQAVPGTQVNVPVQPNGRRDINASWVLIINVITRSTGGEAEIDCGIAQVGLPGTPLITARGYQTLRPGYSELSFAGFYSGFEQRQVELRCRQYGGTGTHVVARAKMLAVAGYQLYANLPEVEIPLAGPPSAER